MYVRPLLNSENLYYTQNTHPMSSKFHLSNLKTYFSPVYCQIPKNRAEEVEWAIREKIQTGGGSGGYGISRHIKEITCAVSGC